MAERWRCSPSTRGASPVERDWRGSGASRCRGEHGALSRRCRKAWWRAGHTRGGGALVGEESEGERGLTVRFQALGGVSRNGEVRAELGREESTNGSHTEEEWPEQSSECQWQWRCSARAVQGRESERGRAERHNWQRRVRRVRPGAPGGRPGCVHSGACAPRGGQALPARHGDTARPFIAWTRARARGGGDALVGWVGFGQRARSEAAAC